MVNDVTEEVMDLDSGAQVGVVVVHEHCHRGGDGVEGGEQRMGRLREAGGLMGTATVRRAYP